MEAIHLPSQILRNDQPAQANTLVSVARTPPPIGMTPFSDESESTWQAVAYEYTRGEIFATHDRNLRMSRSMVLMITH